MAESGRLYAFGLGGSGQLGMESSFNKNLPSPVQGPFVPDRQRAGAATVMSVDNEGSPLVIQRIYTGGDHCFVIYKPVDVRFSFWPMFSLCFDDCCCYCLAFCASAAFLPGLSGCL